MEPCSILHQEEKLLIKTAKSPILILTNCKNWKKAKNGRRPELSKKGRDFSTQTVVRSIHWEVNP